MSRKTRNARYILVVLLVALCLSLTGCLDMVNWGDPAAGQPGGEDSTAGEVIVRDAENVTRTLSHNVSSSAVRTRYDPGLERVSVELTDEIDAEYMRVDFGGDATARARLKEKGDRAVLGNDGLYVSGSAEDMTRELYAQGNFEGGPGGFSGVSYGDEVNITASAVEEGVAETVFQETETLGHGEVNAQVDYLFDSTENQLRVVYASNVNADHVDVTFSMGDNISKVRLHEPGDEARISSDYGKVETVGSAENLMRKELADAVQQYDRYRKEETNFSDIADEASGHLDDVGSYGDLQDEINNLQSQNGLTDAQQSELSTLLEARRELRVTEAGDLSLHEIQKLYLKYTGQVTEYDDVSDLDSVLNDDVFDEDLLSSQGNFLDDDDDDIPDISQSYDRPQRGELLSVRAVAEVAPRETPSGVRQRGGTQTEVLDVSGELSSDGYTEVGDSIGGSITLPSETATMTEETAQAVESLDTDAVADRLTTLVNQRRAEASGYTPELEVTHGMMKAAEDHVDRMEFNIDEDDAMNDIRSGAAPAQTSERNRKQRYIRNAATACHTGGGANSLYTQGSYVALTDEVEGTIERTATSTVTVNPEGMAPVTVPSYALPLYEVYVYDSWKGGDEINEAYLYDEMFEGSASATDVADAIFEDWTESNRLDRKIVDSSYHNQGVGVSVDEETGVIYTTASFC